MKQLMLVLFIFALVFPAMSQSKECVTDTKSYAAKETWYINNEPIQFNGKKYVKYGLPRVLSLDEIEAKGNYKNTIAFIEKGSEGVPEVLYIPVREGCEFQPYVIELPACEVKVKVTATPKTSSAGNTYVFTAATTTKLTKLEYSWYISLTDKDGEELSVNTDEIVAGKTTGKTLVVKTKGMKKGTKIEVTIYVSQPSAECKAAEATTAVAIK